MQFNNVVIETMQHIFPPDYMTSEEIEIELSGLYEKLKLPFGRLELMTGIERRGFWPVGTRPSDLSTLAGVEAIKKSKIKREDLGLLIHSSVCRDQLEPATASAVHYGLELPPRCMFFDLSNACLGFIDAMVVAANFIERGALDSAIIVSGENSGPLMSNTLKGLKKRASITRREIRPLIANLTIGSGAVAYILCRKDLSPHSPQLLWAKGLTESSAHHLCRGEGDKNSLTMHTHAEALLAEGIELAMKNWALFLAEAGSEWANPSWAISHQVGQAHERAVKKALKLTEVETFLTYPQYGNMGSAALPITLSCLNQEKQIPRGSKLVLLGIGSGLSSTFLGVEW